MSGNRAAPTLALTGLLTFGAAMVIGAPASAEVITLVCTLEDNHRTVLDVDTQRRTVRWVNGYPDARTVSAQITERHFIFASPYTDLTVRIDRRTGMSGGSGYGSVGDCRRTSGGF